MRSSPLTRSAFNPKPEPGDVSAVEEPTRSTVLILGPEAFKAGIELEDANRSTIFDDETLAAFDASEYVTAVFGNAKRILKEMEPDGSFYVDDGSDETPITDPEPVAEAEAPAVAPDSAAALA